MRTAIYGLICKLYHMIDDYIYRARIRTLLARGLVLGKNVTIARTAVIDTSYPYLISIGDNCSIAEQTRIWAHDGATFKFTGGYARLGKVEIRQNCFIGDRSTILPGIVMGPNVLVTAGSVVTRDVPPNSCVAGVPARMYAKFDDYVERNLAQMNGDNIFEYSDLVGNLDRLTEQLKAKVCAAVQDGRSAYVRGNSGKYPYTWNRD